MHFLMCEKSKLKFHLNPSKIGMDQIIKLTTQMATTAITQVMTEKIIASAKSLREDGEFDFDTFFTSENINQVITADKMNITEARKLLNINNGKTKKTKDPSKPKKLNGYLLFCNEERAKLKEEDDFTDAAFVDIAKELGVRWRKLTESEKNIWKEKAIEMNKSIDLETSDTESDNPKKKTKKKTKKKKKSKKNKAKELPKIEEDEDEESPDDFSDTDN